MITRRITTRPARIPANILTVLRALSVASLLAPFAEAAVPVAEEEEEDDDLTETDGVVFTIC